VPAGRGRPAAAGGALPGRRLLRPDRRGRARAGRRIVCPPAGRPVLHAGGAAVLVSRRAVGGAGDQDPGLAEPAWYGDRPARSGAEHLRGGASGQGGVLISQHFAVLGAALPLAGFVSYIWDMTRGRAEPNRVSWALWASAPLIAFAAEIVQGTNMQVALVTVTLGLGPLLVRLVSLANGGCYWKLARLDVVCGGLSAAAIAAWVMTGRGDSAIALSIGADAFAAVPTVLKSYARPESESP